VVGAPNRLGARRSPLTSAARRIGIALLVVVGCVWLALWAYSLRPAPEAQPCALPTAIGELGAICGFRNPEDLEYVESFDRVLVSEEGLGGRLLALRPSDLAAGLTVLWPPGPESERAPPEGTSPRGDCQPPQDPEHYAPHGLSVFEPSTPGDPVRVAVVFHHLDESGIVRDAVQLFEFVDGGDALRWQGCVRYPEHAIGNDLAWRGGGALLATRFVRADTPDEIERRILLGSLGFETGDVLTWSPGRGWLPVPHTSAAIPNGIAVARDGQAFYFADSGRWRVAIVPWHARGNEIRSVEVGGAPDNLTISASGKILASVVTLGGDLPLAFICAFRGRTCRTGWAVWEIDPDTGSAVEVLAGDGKRIASVPVALEVGDFLLLGSIGDDRVGVFRRR
jgi:hypothetical protein